MTVNIFVRTLDALEVLLRLPLYAVCAPLRASAEFFDHPSILAQALSLTRFGFGAALIRARMANAGGRFANQAVIIESVLSHLEDELDLPLSRKDRIALFCLYRDLIHAYFLDGHMEDAAEVAVRACRFLGREALPGFGDLTFKNAQLIKASLAAGRMIDPETDTTFVVRARYKRRRILEAGGKRRQSKAGDEESRSIPGLAKVIPLRPNPDIP